MYLGVMKATYLDANTINAGWAFLGHLTEQAEVGELTIVVCNLVGAGLFLFDAIQLEVRIV